MSRETLLAALCGRAVPGGAIPWLPYAGVYAAARVGASPEAYVRDPEAIARGASSVAERFAADGVPLLAEIPCELLALGGTVRWLPDAPPEPSGAPLLAEWSAGDPLPDLPDGAAGLYPVLREAAHRLRARLAGRAAIVGMVTGPATLALQLRGLRLYRDMLAQPDTAHALYAYAGALAARGARIMAELGCDVVALVETAATMLKPDVFETFVTPNLRPGLRAIVDAGAISSLWC